MNHDLIKKEDVLNALKLYGYLPLDSLYYTIEHDLPSVEIPHSDDWEKYSDKLWRNAYERGKADRPQGDWLKFGLGRGTRILFCTNCERRIEVPLSQGDSNYDFCPNCGCRMKGADDETD